MRLQRKLHASFIRLAQLTLLTGLLAPGVQAAGAGTASVDGTTATAPAPMVGADSAEPRFPRYKPSSTSPEPMDIRTAAYGASRSAPDALSIGERVPIFDLARAGGGTVSLQSALDRGVVVLIFYRGHW
jgi:hypothetical protein